MHPLAENPFFILALPATATPMEIERQGKKLLSMLELGLIAAQTYETPYGRKPRTPEDVRGAVQLLLDPARRLPFEPWAAWQPSSSHPASTGGAPVAGPERALAGDDVAGLAWWNP